MVKKKKNIDITELEKKINKKRKNKNVINNKNEVSKLSNKSQFSLFEYLLIIVIISLFFSLIGYFIGRKFDGTLNSNQITANKEVQKFIEEYNYILENYYGELNEEELILNAIKGMLSSLDGYSQYVGDDSDEFSISLKGEYTGLGIGIINNSQQDIVISKIYPNSPAEKAGIKVNDVIIKFNNEELSNTTSTELVEKISNTENINFTILRDEKELNFELKKEKIIIQSVHSKMMDNNIGYIKVDIFANNTYSQFEKSLSQLENNNMESLIIDLRGNGGGDLLTLRNILSLFMNDQHIIYQTEDKNGIETIYSSGNEDKKYQIVILQDLGSASASEVMATSLREQLGAYIIGDTSYGKGTIQSLQTISDLGQYKVTTKKWLTSKGEWINEIGVKPDLEISLSDEYYKNPNLETDNQFQEALKYLKGKEN